MKCFLNINDRSSSSTIHIWNEYCSKNVLQIFEELKIYKFVSPNHKPIHLKLHFLAHSSTNLIQFILDFPPTLYIRYNVWPFHPPFTYTLLDGPSSHPLYTLHSWLSNSALTPYLILLLHNVLCCSLVCVVQATLMLHGE